LNYSNNIQFNDGKNVLFFLIESFLKALRFVARFRIFGESSHWLCSAYTEQQSVAYIHVPGGTQPAVTVFKTPQT